MAGLSGRGEVCGERRRVPPRAAVLLATLALVGAHSSVAAVAAAEASPAVAMRPGGKGAKLSPRLAALTRVSIATAPTSRAQAEALSLPATGVGSLVRRSDGTVVVQIRVDAVSSPLQARLQARGAHVISVSPEYDTVTASVAPDRLSAIAADPGVRYVGEVLAPEIASDGPPAMRSGLASVAAPCGSVTSEGDTLMNVAAGRTASGIDGTGVTVGILSDSFKTVSTGTTAADDVASGDLPGPGNPCGRTTPVAVGSDYSGPDRLDEGRAAAQLVHDLAPGSRLAFRSASFGDTDFAVQIGALRTAEHADVIVDDVGYLNEPFFQNGPIASAAAAVRAAGVSYFSAAGNSNVIVGGKNVSSYEAPSFRSTTCPLSVQSVEPTLGCHDFDPSAGDDSGDAITLAPFGGFVLDLQWAQPWFAAATDYDLFLIDAGGAVVASARTDSLMSGTPFEALGYSNVSFSPQTVRVVIAKTAGAADPRLKFLFAGSGGIASVEHNESAGGDVVGPAIFGHDGAPAVGSTAAIPYDDSTRSEDFSSRGPLTLYFEDTPSATPLASPLVVDKPDFAATDGVATTFFGDQVAGVWRFGGTSAAAPQAAAIAALIRAKNPAATPDEVMTAMRGTARPVAVNGTPDAVGVGYLDAAAALSSVVAFPGAPETLIGVAGNGRVTLHWLAGRTNPHVPNTGYVVTPILGGVAQAPRTFATSATAQVITGLTNGTFYTFKVAGVNKNGTGPQSKESFPVKPGRPQPPGVPHAVPGNGSARVSWTAPTNVPGIPMTSYNVTPYKGGVAQPIRVFASAATTQVITGLTNGASYTFQVAATTAFGLSSKSAASAAIKVGSPVAPAPPVWAPTLTGALVAWKPPATNNGSPILGYVVTPFFRGSSPRPGVPFGPTATGGLVTGVVTGETYSFTVAAKNANGTGPASAQSQQATVGGPVAPPSVTAVPGNTEAKVSWKVPASNGAPITAYTVSVIGGPATVSSVRLTNGATTAVMGGLANGTSYAFAVSAENTRGNGPSTRSAPIVVGAPTAPVLSAVSTPGQAMLTWTAPAANGSPVTSYTVTVFLDGVLLSARTRVITCSPMPCTPPRTKTLAGLTSGNTYAFKVAATNVRGTGPPGVTTRLIS